MTDRPILMSAPMVRATLREIEQPGSGKTMTRRLAWREIKCPAHLHDDPSDPTYPAPTIWQSVRPGDRLWLRETWRTHAMFDAIRPRDLMTASIHYDCDGPVKSGKTRVSIHMPRRYSRITLVVTATSKEPLLDISEEDARAEGFEEGRLNDGFGPRDIGGGYTVESPGTFASASGMFQIAWAHLHPDWDCYSSPEVVPISFVPHLCNIDAMERTA